MACKATKRVAGEDWPLYERTSSEKCCYNVDVGSTARAHEVTAEAAQMPGYVKRSRFYDMPRSRIRFYLYFAS